MDAIIIDWDGSTLPAELRELPPGRYLVQPLDEERPLTPEEDAGLRLGLDQLNRGEWIPADVVLEQMRQRIEHK